MSHHRDDPRLLRLLIEEAPLDRDVLRRVEEHQRDRVQALQDLLARHPEVRVDDTDAAVRILTTTVEIVVHGLCSAPDQLEPERLEDQLTAMINRYLGGAPASPS